jgi:hypothetical protein
MMKNEELLPPIIKDLIVELRNEETPMHIRDAFCGRLENIVQCCADSIEVFRRKQAKHYTIKSKQKL